MTRLIHTSDTHGWLRPLADVETCHAVVHSGDFLPNRTFGLNVIEEPFQRYWLEENAKKIEAWLGGKPLYITSGNHDFVNISGILQENGVEAYSLDNGTQQDLNGYLLVGFQYVPEFGGQWNYELDDYALTERLNAIDLEGVDVLVAHSPIYGVLDRNAHGERCGSMPMRLKLEESRHVPSWYLHGHIHESAGDCGWVRGIKVSNAATTQRIIEL